MLRNCFLALLTTIITFSCVFTFAKGAIKCMDDWSECNGGSGPRSECSADSCSISLVPIPSCGSFMLRTCSVDFDCYKSLSKDKHEFFNVKRVGLNSLTYDYCCMGADYCNNMTESRLINKFCEWMKENAAEIGHHARLEARRLCGIDLPVDNAIDVNIDDHAIINTKPNIERQPEPPADDAALKCACDLNIPGRFSQCHMPSEETFLFGFENEEDVMPHCYSSDGSCSTFLTLEMDGEENATADIFRGCIDRKLPVSNCENVGVAGSFVEVDPRSISTPFIFEYCCSGDNFCNAMTIDDTVRKMCEWLKEEQKKERQAQRQTLPKSTPGERNRRNGKVVVPGGGDTASVSSKRRQAAAARRENRKHALIMRNFCQDVL